MYPFDLNEGVYWWSEGVTEYISQKALYELGLISEEEFQRDLIRKFIAYNSLSIKNDVDLVQATRVPDPNEEETSLQYDKGALVACLLDQQLQARGQNIEVLLTDFYQTYALTQKPIDNQELINYIDSYLGESSFTEEYILGTEQLPLSEFNFGWRYYWEIVERYLPPVPFPYNILIPLVAILVVLVTGRLLYKIILVRISLRKAKQSIE
jgi:predicted metalloprotease with PDZ domain